MSDLRLSDADEVLLESLVLSAADNVAKAESSKRANHAPTRRRAYVETDTDNVYLGTGSQWVDVSENTGLLSSLFDGGDGNFESVNTDNTTYKGSPYSEENPANEFDVGITQRTIPVYTEDIAQTATTIYEYVDSDAAHLLFVKGQRDDGDGGTIFLDRVVFTPFGGPPNVETLDEKSTATTRNYSEDGYELQLDMGTDTYDVNVLAHAMV